MPPTNIPFTRMYCRPLPTLALISDTNWSSSQRFISPATKIAERALMSLHQLPQHGHEACVNVCRQIFVDLQVLADVHEEIRKACDENAVLTRHIFHRKLGQIVPDPLRHPAKLRKLLNVGNGFVYTPGKVFAVPHTIQDVENVPFKLLTKRMVRIILDLAKKFSHHPHQADPDRLVDREKAEYDRHFILNLLLRILQSFLFMQEFMQCADPIIQHRLEAPALR